MNAAALREIAAYHEVMAATASDVATLAYMPLGKGLHAKAEKHKRWAAELRKITTVMPGWIATADRLPSHLHSVLGWVTGGPLVHDDPFADTVSYDPDRRVWLQSTGMEDAIVPVSHWMPLPHAPNASMRPLRLRVVKGGRT